MWLDVGLNGSEQDVSHDPEVVCIVMVARLLGRHRHGQSLCSLLDHGHRTRGARLPKGCRRLEHGNVCGSSRPRTGFDHLANPCPFNGHCVAWFDESKLIQLQLLHLSSDLPCRRTRWKACTPDSESLWILHHGRIHQKDCASPLRHVDMCSIMSFCEN